MVTFASKSLLSISWRNLAWQSCEVVYNGRIKRIIICLFTKTTSSINFNNLWFIYQLWRQNKVSYSFILLVLVIQLYNKLMLSLLTANLQVWRHARNWQSCQVVSFMKNLFLEDELKYFFLRFYWDVCLFTLVKPIIMGGVVFTSPWHWADYPSKINDPKTKRIWIWSKWHVFCHY